MKSTKYTQETVIVNDNDFTDYQNIPTAVLQKEKNQNQRTKRTTSQPEHQYQNVNNSEEILINNAYDMYSHEENVFNAQSPEANANRYPGQDFELVCNCSIKDVVHSPKARLKQQQHCSSEQNVMLSTRSCCSTPKLGETRTFSQFSLDRRHVQPKHQAPVVKHTYVCDQPSTGIRRNPSLKRIQSPEIINTHLGPNNFLYDGYGPENCAIKSYGYDKDLKNDDYGFRRGASFRRASERCFFLDNKQRYCRVTVGTARSDPTQPRQKKRVAGDGMDSEMDDPELMFEPTDHLRACRCPCDHVIYSPGYSCLQDDRLPPAPDVTRRLGSATPLGKPEAGTPPYYRTASGTTNSSSTNSASSRMDLSTRHWWIIVTVLLLAAAAGVGVPIALKISAGASLEERLEFASRLLQEVPLIDGHNDLPWNIRKFLHNRLKDFKFGEDLRNVTPWSNSAWSHTDLPRLKQGHVAAQFWAAYVPCDSQYKDAVQLTLEQIDVIRRLTELYHPSLTLCTSAEDIKKAYGRHQLCSLIGVEGGHSLAGSLAVLRTLYHVGVRYLTLTSTCNTPWADCSHEDMPGKKPEHGGLTNFGKSVVKEMNRLGMIVDLSHVSVRTMRDALAVSKAPVIFSHSSAHALCNSTRNVPDATLRKLALNKGVIMVNFYSHFLTCKDVATVSDAVAHINHIRDVAGVDNVGLGAGYDGINYVPKGLEDVSSYPTLFAELIGTGRWSTEDLKKLAGLNFLRVLQEVETVRDEFKKAKVPPYEDVMVPRPNPNNCSSQDLF